MMMARGQVTGDGTYPELAMKEVFRRTCRDIKTQYGYEVTIPELQNCLEKGTVKVVNRKKMISKNYSINEILEKNCIGVCHDAIEKMKSIHDYFSKYDCIIATGGTYDAWSDEFNKTFRDMEEVQVDKIIYKGFYHCQRQLFQRSIFAPFVVLQPHEVSKN